MGAASLGRTGGGQGCKDDNNNDSENDNSVDAAFVGAIGVLPIVAIADEPPGGRPGGDRDDEAEQRVPMVRS